MGRVIYPSNFWRYTSLYVFLFQNNYEMFNDKKIHILDTSSLLLHFILPPPLLPPPPHPSQTPSRKFQKTQNKSKKKFRKHRTKKILKNLQNIAKSVCWLNILPKFNTQHKISLIQNKWKKNKSNDHFQNMEFISTHFDKKCWCIRKKIKKKIQIWKIISKKAKYKKNSKLYPFSTNQIRNL